MLNAYFWYKTINNQITYIYLGRHLSKRSEKIFEKKGEKNVKTWSYN